MHIFGLTGGIASGKSTVAARLRARGVPIMDADELARAVVAKGTDALAEIVTAFGDDVLLADGTLDRKRVAQIVFHDDDKRRALNAITHPRIGALFRARSDEYAAQGEPLACWEAALLVENGLADAFRPLVVVAAPDEVQLARVQSRDQASAIDAMARIRSQLPLAAKIAVADYVIETIGTLADNARRTDEVLSAICEKLGVDVGRYRSPAPHEVT